MKVLLLQNDIKWKQPAENRLHISQMLQSAEKSDLIILPEMFTTGFCVLPEGVAEKADTETLVWMQATAKEKNAAIAGSVATEENGRYYNRLYFVKPDGTYITYNKRHLFTFGGEHKGYEAGKDRVIVEYAGVRILLLVCYDLRFPVFSRNRNDYDMIIYVASWPISRIEVWNTLLKARAIENVCYVAGVNRTGNDPSNEYNGSSVMINYLGQVVAAAALNNEDTVSYKIDIDELSRFRQKFPALNDADQFRIIE